MRYKDRVIIYKYRFKMDNVKKLDTLIMKSTSESLQQIPQQILNQILQLVSSRVDMPKNVINSISKRMVLKNKRVLINIFIILEFLGYQCELSFYSQISTKQFLFKISGILMNKDIDPMVKSKVMETVYCWEELFRPHEDLLPMFFQFYAGLLRNNFEIPHDYKSPFRPAQLKQYKKPEQPKNPNEKKPASQKSIAPTITEKKTFEQIRQKLILTNEIIDNANPADNIKQNGLLLEMIEQVKQCEKKINKTISQNPSQILLELALAANDDIVVTYKRFKDLQRNKRPEPFIFTQLASDVLKQQQLRKTNSSNQNQNQNQKVNNQPKKQVNIFDLIQDQPQKQPQKVEKKSSKQQDLFDLDFQPQGSPKKQQPKTDIFDLLGDNTASQNAQTQPPNNLVFDIFPQQNPPTVAIPPNNNTVNLGNFQDLLKTGNYQNIPGPSGNGITLNVVDFTTQNDFNKNKTKTFDKLDQLTNDFLSK